MTLITDDMKTDWFPSEIEPKHVGDYEVWRPGMECIGVPEVHTLHWNGRDWSYAYTLGYSDKGSLASLSSCERWRGLKAPYDGQTS